MNIDERGAQLLDGTGERPDLAPRNAGARPVIVDAGVGNLGNLARALRHLGAEPEVTAEAERVAAARCLLLPGVGAFAPPREALRGELEAALKAALAEGAWLLGICVGFQLLFESGEEFGTTDGLGLLPGRVTRLPGDVPLPHIGWNRLHHCAGDAAGSEAGGPENGAADGKGSARLLAGLPPDPYVYFVHSYAPEGVPAELCLARTTHGRDFPAAAGRGRVLGTQFHPEKSAEVGLRVLANFLEMSDGE
jgi:imidazole glycerol-phosphate synthase subunit HisH